MKKCYCCGADVPDQSKFCPKCGKPMAVTKDLIDRAMENDPEAQAELYERTYKTVYSRIRAKVPDEDTAMDIMQETYLRAFTGLDQLQKPETFPSWLLSIASRQVCDWFRKNGKENENVQMSQLEYENDDTISDEDDLLDQPEYREDFSPDEALDRAETGRLLSEILDNLPEDQRIILTMRYYDELSLKEISEELGLNINTVKTRLTAAKKKVEAKVMELEKSGTKLYSLGPVAFLVFLLHHAELFAPAISANTIIGLTAAGAGAGAAATAAHVTVATAAKTAVAAAAKGISVKAVAIVAAAVVVVGGGTTATVVAVNNAREPSDTAATETYGTDSSGSSQDMFVGLTPDETPAEEVEAEPEPSEEPGETDNAEEPTGNNTESSEENTEQQEPEPSVSEEVQEEPAVLPSEDVVMNLADLIVPIWGSSAVEYYSGQVYLNTNQAVEMATILAYWVPKFTPPYNSNYESYYPDEKYTAYGYTYDIVVDIIPASTVQTYMTKLFGSQYQLSGYSNSEYDSAFETSIPGFTNPLGETVSRNDNGDFEIKSIVWDDSLTGGNISVESIIPTGTNSCNAVIQFDNMDYEIVRERHTMRFGLVEDPSAEYGWAITSITLNG